MKNITINISVSSTRGFHKGTSGWLRDFLADKKVVFGMTKSGKPGAFLNSTDGKYSKCIMAHVDMCKMGIYDTHTAPLMSEEFYGRPGMLEMFEDTYCTNAARAMWEDYVSRVKERFEVWLKNDMVEDVGD